MNQPELEAYLDEALPVEEMARIEDTLRRNPELLDDLSAINARRDAGVAGGQGAPGRVAR